MRASLSQFAVFTFLKRAGLAAVAICLATPAFADIIYTGSSVVATGSNGGLSARATFSVSATNANVLNLLLENTSSGPTMAPSELLTSMYFNVLTGTVTGSAAPLTYANATGQVYIALKNFPDKAASYVPPITSGSAFSYPVVPTPSNLQAFNKDDDTWQFRNDLSLVASQPPLKFGVGTVGNSNLAPNGFNGNITDGFNFGIYKGDVTTQNLDNTPLVKDSILFQFAGFSGYKLSQVTPHVVFGFGTAPDVIVTVPEPATLSLAAFGLITALATLRRPRRAASASVHHAGSLQIGGA